MYIMYNEYNNAIKRLENNEDPMLILMTPLSPYLFCDYYYSINSEIFNNARYSVSDFNTQSLRKISKNILTIENANTIKDFDIIHVTSEAINEFVNIILPHINNKFILITGRMNLPQIDRSCLTDKLLLDKRLILWFSQNPIYEESDKYKAIPYGLNNWRNNLNNYCKKLLDTNDSKILNCGILPLGKTHKCREIFPILNRIENVDYFIEMSKYKFIISPIGDRHDCHRHWEAIGLGSIPICNIDNYYKSLFGNNMIYVKDEYELKDILDSQNVNRDYIEPNKNMITIEYWQKFIQNQIELKKMES